VTYIRSAGTRWRRPNACIMSSAATAVRSTVAPSITARHLSASGRGGPRLRADTVMRTLSAPAGILIAKVMIPERGVPETLTRGHAATERTSINVIDAAAQGAAAGLRLAAYVGALLIAFVALIALVNDGLGSVGHLVGIENFTLQRILGVLLAPVAWLMGVPWEDATRVGALLGIKTVLNEFLAYLELSALMQEGILQPRSVTIASYALCGFANFGSLAILLGGIGGIAPSRRGEIAELGLRSILSGSLATFMTACIAGMLL